MSSSNGGVPPGFRFHPTDEELLHYYLKKKISFDKFEMEVIKEVDLNKIEPWDLQEKCRIGSTPQNEWYFFSHKDRKYPTGSRTNRATHSGFWKATGRDKCIRNCYKKIGMRKTLVFYKGRAPHGQKTDWIMHEYRLEDTEDPQADSTEDGWVVCRVFKKKNLFKIGNGSNSNIHEVSNNNTLQARSFMHRESPYQLIRNHGITNFELNKPAELELHQYPPMFQSQAILKPSSIGYGDYSTGLPKDCENVGNEGIQYQQEVEIGTCKIVESHEQESVSEWGMMNRLTSNDESSRSMNNLLSIQQPSNLLSLRGEMDLWGYSK